VFGAAALVSVTHQAWEAVRAEDEERVPLWSDGEAVDLTRLVGLGVVVFGFEFEDRVGD